MGEKRRNKNMPARIPLLFFFFFFSKPHFKLHSSLKNSSSSSLVSLHKAHFLKGLYTPPPPTHTHSLLTQTWEDGGDVWSRRWWDSHASLPHKCVLIGSHRSHMLTNRSFWGGGVLRGRMCARPLVGKCFVIGWVCCQSKCALKWSDY